MTMATASSGGAHHLAERRLAGKVPWSADSDGLLSYSIGGSQLLICILRMMQEFDVTFATTEAASGLAARITFSCLHFCSYFLYLLPIRERSTSDAGWIISVLVYHTVIMVPMIMLDLRMYKGSFSPEVGCWVAGLRGQFGEGHPRETEMVTSASAKRKAAASQRRISGHGLG